MVVGVAKTVRDAGLAVPVTEFLGQRERLLAGGDRLLVLAELEVAPADVVEDQALSAPVAGGAEQVEGQPALVQRVGVVAMDFLYLAEHLKIGRASCRERV